MASYTVTYADERGETTVTADKIALEDGIYEFWRGDDVFQRVPAAQITAVDPPVSDN